MRPDVPGRAARSSTHAGPAIRPILLPLAGACLCLTVAGSGAGGSAEATAPPHRQQPIHRERIVTLGEDPEGPLLSRLTDVAMDGEGFFHAGPTYEPGEIVVFDPRGRYRGRFGRSGQGPGEFSAPILRLRIGPGYSVHVFDGPRHSVLQPRAAGFARLHMLPFLPVQALVREDGRLVVVSLPLDRPDSAPPLVHILTAEGRLERSFGHEPEYDPARPHTRLRVLADAPGVGVWVGHVRRYEIEAWSMEGERLRRIVRNVPWFPEWSGDSRLAWERPRLGAIVQQDRYLWTLIHVPDPDFDRTGVDLHRPVEEVDLNAEHDTVIEVLDLETRRIVARQRFRDHLFGFLGAEPIVFVRRAGPLGNIIVEVYRLRVGER